MADDFINERFDYAFKNMPKGQFGGLDAMMWAFGVPGFGQGINENAYMGAIRKGQNPVETLPWLNGTWGGTGATGTKLGATKDPLAAMPQWYRDWYNEQGKYGGVPPVAGLL